ncbi:Mu transposase domain-containing protein [Streptomyces tubbatahanensis]|uniref:Mu transposase domain-containing protein n=1 Tax=Streptomyces tubbatahanensis TaxID=2923272 RepID=UPI003C6FC744
MRCAPQPSDRTETGPLPGEPFETGRVFERRVDRYGRIPVRAHRYSAPLTLAGSLATDRRRHSSANAVPAR